MRRLKLLVALVAVLALVAAACGDSDSTTTTGGETTTTAAGDTTTTAAAGGDEDLVIGVSWNNYNEERWAKSDEPAIKAAIESANGRYISADAGSSAEQQINDVEQLISEGADALIILAQDGTAILPAVQSALDQGVPVIAYDRLIENSGALYITFDNVEVGRMQARVIFDLVPEGNYVFIKGNSADANADFLRGGQQEILQAAIDSGAIVNVGESYTDNWDPAVAQVNMEQFLTQNNNEVDAVVASNDGMAGGVVEALRAQGLAGIVPVSGQDGDAAALNRVALGEQSVSVWKDARQLGQAAGAAAVSLANGTPLGDVPTVQPFDSPGGNTMTSILLPPIPITQDNLNVVLEAGWIAVDTLCQNVAAGTVAACEGGTTTTAAAAGDEDLVIGVSWNNYNEERWAKSDEPAIKAAIDEAGGRYISADAGSSAEQQINDVEQLISEGADALIILAQDGTAILPAVQSALDQGVPVIAYDRLIENSGALYVTFDNVEVGRMQARVIFDLVPEGNYVFIKGNSADANADFLRGGQQEILQAAIDSGAIVNVGESYTDNWDPAVAQVNMEQFLTQNNNEVDAVVASNDGMAGGVVEALRAQGLAGIVPVSGQDGDAAALNRVALGEQSVSVWKDARQLGSGAGTAAVALALGAALGDVPGVVAFDSPGGNTMTSILLPPIPITQDNLNVVVEAEWIDVDTLCQNVAAGTVAACG